MVIDPSQAVDRVRLMVGDTQDLIILSDDTYQYLLDKNNGNENAAAKESAYMILAQLSYNTRVRLDRIETYSQQAFENYLKFIKEYIKSGTGPLALAGIYAAGISKTDILQNQADPDIVQRRMPWGPNGEYSPITNPFDCDSSSF